MDIKVLESIIWLRPKGKVFVYSSPAPSEFSNARGISKTKIPPIRVETSNVEARSTSKFAKRKDIIIVSKTGREKKKAVAGFLEEIFKSFMTKPNKGLRVFIEKSFAVSLDNFTFVPLDICLTVFKIHVPANPETPTYVIKEIAENNVVNPAAIVLPMLAIVIAAENG